MAKTNANKENGSAKKLKSSDNESGDRKRKRADSVSDAPDQSDNQNTKFGTSRVQALRTPKKRARVGRKAENTPMEAKQKGRKIKQDCSEELVDMTEWMAPNSLGNSSSMWRPKNKAREEEMALGLGVYAAVKAQRAAHRSAKSQTHVDSVLVKVQVQRPAEDRKRKVEEVYAAWEAEKAAAADLISERGKSIASKLLSQDNVRASSVDSFMAPHACGTRAANEMSNGKIHNQIFADLANASNEEIREAIVACAREFLVSKVDEGSEEMLKTHPNPGSWRLSEERVEVIDGASGVETSSV
ncbi:hypothetical protein BST61_g9673 [Cercospora zeina]